MAADSFMMNQEPQYILHAGETMTSVHHAARDGKNDNPNCVGEYIRDGAEADKRGTANNIRKARGSRSGTGLPCAYGRVVDER
jgi:hypothetical protein